MSHTPLSAQQLDDAAPLGALVRFSDGAAEPPQRHHRKHATWRSSNGTGRLVRKAPQKQALPASFTLHVGDFGSDEVTVVKAYRVFAVTSPLSFAIVDKPRAPARSPCFRTISACPPSSTLPTRRRTQRAWLTAHPRDNVRLVPVEALEPRTFTYLQDPGHGWLIVSRGDLAGAGMSPADFSSCSYVRGAPSRSRRTAICRDSKRLDEWGNPYRLREQHTDAGPRPPLGRQSWAHGGAALRSPPAQCPGATCQAQSDRNTSLTARAGTEPSPQPHAERGPHDHLQHLSRALHPEPALRDQHQCAERRAALFAEEIRKRAGTAPFEAIGEPFSGDWQSEEICSANTPDLLAAVANALDQLRRGGPRWTIEESPANALARAKAQGSVS